MQHQNSAQPPLDVSRSVQLHCVPNALLTCDAHLVNYNRDCAYVDGFPVLAQGLDVVTLRTSLTNYVLLERKEVSGRIGLGFETGVLWSSGLQGFATSGQTR